MERTSQPRASRQSQRCEPRNPAPPVTTARKGKAFSYGCLSDDRVSLWLGIVSHRRKLWTAGISSGFQEICTQDFLRGTLRVSATSCAAAGKSVREERGAIDRK